MFCHSNHRKAGRHSNNAFGHRKKLEKLIKGINTSICEQVFSWFRNFTTNFNELRGNRHKFVMLYTAKKHNKAITSKSASYLRPVIKKSHTSKSYGCNTTGKKNTTKAKSKLKKEQSYHEDPQEEAHEEVKTRVALAASVEFVAAHARVRLPKWQAIEFCGVCLRCVCMAGESALRVTLL